MKTDIHPQNYRPVIFQDTSSNAQFLIGSTVVTTEKGNYDGKEYDLVKIEISSDSHPFYTGNEKVLDSGGRVDRFKKRMEAASAAPAKKKKVASAEEKKEEVVETSEEVVAEVTETIDEAAEAPVAETSTEEETKEAA